MIVKKYIYILGGCNKLKKYNINFVDNVDESVWLLVNLRGLLMKAV